MTRHLGRLLGVLLIAGAAALGRPPAGPHAPSEARPRDQGRVTHVYDGDTIAVRLDRGRLVKVRLIGVDTPERGDTRPEPKFWAEMATRYAVYRLLDQRVSLSYDLDPKDKYGRVLAYVWREDGEFFNERLIRDGFSPAFCVYPFREDYRAAFRRAEANARESGRGRWSRGQPAALTVTEASRHLGEYGRVRFRCDSVSAGRRYIFLETADRRFQVLVAKDVVSSENAAGGYRGRTLAVTGILEGTGRFLKVYVFFSRQLAVR